MLRLNLFFIIKDGRYPACCQLPAASSVIPGKPRSPDSTRTCRAAAASLSGEPGGGDAETCGAGESPQDLHTISATSSAQSQLPWASSFPRATSRLQHPNRDDQLPKWENPVLRRWPLPQFSRASTPTVKTVFPSLSVSSYPVHWQSGLGGICTHGKGRRASSHSGPLPVSPLFSLASDTCYCPTLHCADSS